MTELPQLATIGVVNTGQGFIPRAIRWVTATQDKYGKFEDAKVNHACLFVGNVPGKSEPQIVEAQPQGAIFAPWNKYGHRIIWLNKMYQAGTGQPIVLTQAQREAIAASAIETANSDVGYNFLDFLAIALAQRRFHRLVGYTKPPWWVKRVASPEHLICSQLDDYEFSRNGVKLFADNRLTGLVSPADLYGLQFPS